MQLVVVTGLSGSGKSIALAVLEDSGYYCVDNLPANLLPQVIGFLEEGGYEFAAASVDVRSGDTLSQLPAHLESLRTRGIEIRVLYLEAKTDTLVKRFSETRRRHPLARGRMTLPECVERERELLAPVVDLAHHVDTSDLSPNALRGWVKDFLGLQATGLTLLFESFGFKHGIPLDADLVFDVRCLPNPHYDPRLQPLTGRDPEVIEFLEATPEAQRMLEDIRGFVERWLPAFIRDNRSYLTVALGCTGGRHRSVYFAEALAQHFERERPVLLRHRELAGESG
jgi:UPF0042 nucleotide-binding protein